MPRKTLEEARRNLVGWVDYWLKNNGEGIRTREQLAERMGVAKSALTPFFKPGERRVPHLKNLIALSNITGISIDTLLWAPLPQRNK